MGGIMQVVYFLDFPPDVLSKKISHRTEATLAGELSNEFFDFSVLSFLFL
jgi:hypothetical protein